MSLRNGCFKGYLADTRCVHGRVEVLIGIPGSSEDSWYNYVENDPTAIKGILRGLKLPEIESPEDIKSLIDLTIESSEEPIVLQLLQTGKYPRPYITVAKCHIINKIPYDADKITWEPVKAQNTAEAVVDILAKHPLFKGARWFNTYADIPMGMLPINFCLTQAQTDIVKKYLKYQNWYNKPEVVRQYSDDEEWEKVNAWVEQEKKKSEEKILEEAVINA
jgi:hypothetical protein